LTERHSAELVANLIGALNLPAALHDQILRKTEGNPFFMEEVIRSLVSDGVLVRDARDQSWQLVKQVDQVQLPDTIQGLILARIDRLEEDVKQALKLASVIGRSFLNRVLEVISKAQPDLDNSLAELEHAELIRQRQQLPELEYIFKHALVQEAAYGSILAESRRTIHRRVAQAIEMLFEDRLDEFTSLLAHHYTCAQDSDKAQEYLFKAGDQAGKMAADTEALEHFRLAEQQYLKAFGNKLKPLQRAALARKVGAALYGTGHYEKALEQFRRALAQLGLRYPTTRWGVRRALAGQLAAHFTRRLRSWMGVPAKRELDMEWASEISTICHFMSWVDYFLDKERMLLDCLLELHAGENSNYSLAEARGLSSLGFGLMTYHVLGMSRGYHLRAMEIARKTNNPSATAFVIFALGFLDFFDGRWDDCDANLGKGAATYRDAGDLHRAGGATLMRSLVVTFRGDLAQTLAMAQDLMQSGQDAGDPQLASWGFQVRGYAQIASGPLDIAVANLRQGVAMAAKIPAWDNFLYQKSLLSKCLVLQGKFDEALAELGEAVKMIKAEQFDKPFDKVEVLTGLATCSLAIAQRADDASRAEALQHARRASRDALQCARQMPLWLPQALRLQGTSEWIAGNLSAARKYWNESTQLAENYGFVIERARTWLEMGDRLGDVTLVQRASEVFLRLGAHVFLATALHSQARLCGLSAADAASARSRYAHAIDALEEVKAEKDLMLAREAYARLVDQPA
jgi:tetratricopeptide (TPR) repeat protein